jgi:quinol monooxygenase YgiN
MFKAVVEFHVKEAAVGAFKKASLENARASSKEPGISCFEVLQRQDDASRFMFIETYLTAEAQLLHRESAHYKLWKSTVEELLAEPRSNVKYDVLEL